MEVAEVLTERWSAESRARLEEWARAAGFDAAGVAALGAAENDDAARFREWVETGRAGEMEYLKRCDAGGTLVRGALRLSMPWARSVVVCALSYHADAPRSLDAAPDGAGWIARYAWSGRRDREGTLVPTDYHDELMGRLRTMEARLHAEVECTTRCYVDTGPLLERGLAARAGIGWIGKNTCVIDQRLGSWLLLGVIVTSLELPGTVAGLPAADRCGTCTRCIDACPTGALLGSRDAGSARQMDATRCIAYLTIEKKGSIPEELRAGIGRQVFGCDICQDVCPWNRRAPLGRHEGMEPRAELINPALEWLAEMDAGEFKRRFKGSPLERTGRRRLRRNVAIAIGNSGDPRFLPALERLAEEASGGESQQRPADPALQDAVAWARAALLDVEANDTTVEATANVC